MTNAPDRYRARGADHSALLLEVVQNFDASVAQLTYHYVRAALDDCGGCVSEAARRLGMHRRTLQRLISLRSAPAKVPGPPPPKRTQVCRTKGKTRAESVAERKERESRIVAAIMAAAPKAVSTRDLCDAVRWPHATPAYIYSRISALRAAGIDIQGRRGTGWWLARSGEEPAE